MDVIGTIIDPSRAGWLRVAHELGPHPAAPTRRMPGNPVLKPGPELVGNVSKEWKPNGYELYAGFGAAAGDGEATAPGMRMPSFQPEGSRSARRLSISR